MWHDARGQLRCLTGSHFESCWCGFYRSDCIRRGQRVTSITASEYWRRFPSQRPDRPDCGELAQSGFVPEPSSLANGKQSIANWPVKTQSPAKPAGKTGKEGSLGLTSRILPLNSRSWVSRPQRSLKSGSMWVSDPFPVSHGFTGAKSQTLRETPI